MHEADETANGAPLHELELVDDGDGLAVIGAPKAVEAYLRSKGLWAGSRELDLGRLSGFGAEALQIAADIAESSGRWVKLTEESAKKVADGGLADAKTPGLKHLMIGKPGASRSWLQTENEPGSLTPNPDLLSGLGGLMAQMTAQQSMAEITAYLVRIDEKVDEMLQKIDDVMVSNLIGAGGVIGEAIAARDAVGVVDEVTWSKVDQTPRTIRTSQDYALKQLEAITGRLESTKVGDLAKAAERAKPDVRTWLAVLAYCFEKQAAIDVLELDWRMARSPETLDGHRRLMRARRDQSRESIAEHTDALLDRMADAVARANDSRLWTRTKSTIVVESGNNVAGEVQGFHEAIEIEAVARSWEVAPLGRAADLGSKSIQTTRDAAPYVGALAMFVAGAAVTAKQVLNDESPEG